MTPPANRRSIPRTGEPLFPVGLGTYRTFDVGADAHSRAPAHAVLKHFGTLGHALVDSSPMYGTAETVLGDLSAALALRERLFIATKVWVNGRDAGLRQIEASFKKLRVQQIDLMQVHNLLDWRTHLPTLRKLKESGRIRYIGISHYHTGAYDEVERVMAHEDIDFLQINYSVTQRTAERRLLPLAQDRGIAVLVNQALDEGALFARVRGRKLPTWAATLDISSWAQLFIKFVLAHPAVTCVLQATRDVDHLTENLRAAYGPLPDTGMRNEIARVLV